MVRFELTINLTRDTFEIIDTMQEVLTIYNDLGDIYSSSAPQLCELLNQYDKLSKTLEHNKWLKEIQEITGEKNDLYALLFSLSYTLQSLKKNEDEVYEVYKWG